MASFEEVLNHPQKPALFIGNGINQFEQTGGASWNDLLTRLGEDYGVPLSKEELLRISNTERYDLLDLAKDNADRTSLQQAFCHLMKSWTPTPTHERIVSWAMRHDTPIITVNFDETLSQAVGAELFKLTPEGQLDSQGKLRDRNGTLIPGFTSYYPWNAYFAKQPVYRPSDGFGIWHAHGMRRYSRSIRLGLTHYMGAAQRARGWIMTSRSSLYSDEKLDRDSWLGGTTWLDIIFSRPIVIFGFGFGMDESFLRWLFIERARFFKRFEHRRQPCWFVEPSGHGSQDRRTFFASLGIEPVFAESYDEMYLNPAWSN